MKEKSWAEIAASAEVTMIQLIESEKFFQEGDTGMYYVGFLKSSQTWFPLALVSDPQEKRELDSLFLSRSSQLMTDMVKQYAEQLQHVEQTFVQYLMTSEIRNLMERYGLKHLAVIAGGGDSHPGCDCGCDCG
jgi:hypothetical protein